MSSLARASIRRMIGSSFLVVLCISLSAQQLTQSTSIDEPEQPLGTQVEHIGNAEAKSVVETGYSPSRQPKIYWNDPDWRVELVIPPAGSKNDAYSLSIRSSQGTESIVKLPEAYGQIDSIARAPGDKAILDAECGGICGGFVVIDLKLGKVIDSIGTLVPFISPNRRFVLFQRGFPPHGPEYPNLYHLYDVMKAPKENVCAWGANDPKHEILAEDWRGFQVYPQKPGQIHCNDLDDLNDDNRGTNFTWAEDSSKVVFADVKNGVTRLILVIMPVGAKGLPKTSVYRFIEDEDVCSEARHAVIGKYCDFHDFSSLAWVGDSVHVGDRTIPISKFVPIGK